jgi:hypothetical protein
MASPASAEEIAISLLPSQSLQLQSITVLQSLWAGYGQIYHITAFPKDLPGETQSYILKLITPPPKFKADDEGYTRKILSYQVEQYFYTDLAPQLPPSISVAKCVASVSERNGDGTATTAMMLSDLRLEFPVAGEKRDVLNERQVLAALDWLSGFHGLWWPSVKDMNREALVRPPLEEVRRGDQDEKQPKRKHLNVWLNGGYTYLATRRKEFTNLAKDYDSEWRVPLTEQIQGTSTLSDMVAHVLAPMMEKGKGFAQEYMTLIHGDVKSENLFTTTSGDAVAFYDFQYTGLGLGVCDLAKLFTCSVPLSLLVEKADEHDVPREMDMQKGERQLLERYWVSLKEMSGKEYEWSVFVRHWETALVDWLRFQASWGFWG